jgi:hypothetical protein
MPGQRAKVKIIKNKSMEIYWTFHRSEHQGMAKKHLNMRLLHCGTASQTISGLKTVFLNLRA